MAGEARHHRACCASYISRVNLKSTGFNEGEKETLYDTALRKSAAEITNDVDDGKAFDISALLS